jgi:molybdenum cofactor biosynthesis enzyme MoaA
MAAVEFLRSPRDEIPNLPKQSGAESTHLLAAYCDQQLAEIDPVTLEPIGAGVRRLEAHGTGRWHEVDSVMVVTSNLHNPLVLVKQRPPNLEFGGNLIDFPVSTHRLLGETRAQTLTRGINTQLGPTDTSGLTAFNLGALLVSKTYASVPAINHEVNNTFATIIPRDVDLPVTEESAGYYWMDLKSLIQAYEEHPHDFAKSFGLFLGNIGLRGYTEQLIKHSLGIDTRSLPDLSEQFFAYTDPSSRDAQLHIFSRREELLEALRAGIFDLPVVKKQRAADTITAPAAPHGRLIIAQNCNFNCPGCKEGGEGPYYVEDILTPAAYMKVLERVAEVTDQAKLSGGEPTLSKYFKEFTEYSRKKFSFLTLITNGWNLKNLTDFLKVNIDTLEVSVDGATSEMFAQMRGTSKSMLKRVKEGIERFVSEVQKPIRINFVASRDNIAELDGILDYAETLNQRIEREKLQGGVSVKVLENVFYEQPGYESWAQRYVDMVEAELIVGRRSGKPSRMKQPPGNFGSPEQVFTLPKGTDVIVRSGKDGQVFADMCQGCPIFPCQDGLYYIAVTLQGYLKMCAHRTDLYVPLFTTRRVGDEMERVITDESIREAIAIVMERYKSAYFLEDGWDPNKPGAREKMKAHKTLDPQKETYQYPKQRTTGATVPYIPPQET